MCRPQITRKRHMECAYYFLKSVPPSGPPSDSERQSRSRFRNFTDELPRLVAAEPLESRPDEFEKVDRFEHLHREAPRLAIREQVVDRGEIRMRNIRQSPELLLESLQADGADRSGLGRHERLIKSPRCVSVLLRT